MCADIVFELLQGEMRTGRKISPKAGKDLRQLLQRVQRVAKHSREVQPGWWLIERPESFGIIGI
jgi:hypothetical protein